MAERGPAVWFGAGSTGKTQLLLWMAAMIASRPQHRAPTWLGGTINGTGHVLILTAEDARPQIIGRLRDIVETTMGQDAAAAHETCSRILSAVAEFERDLLIERTQAGLSRAKAEGKTLGRPSALSAEQLAEVRAKRAEGLSLGVLSKAYGVSRAAIQRAERRA